METTLRVKCIESGRHGLGGRAGVLRIREMILAGRPAQECRFHPDGEEKSMRFGGIMLPLRKVDRAVTLRIQSKNTLWHFETLAEERDRHSDRRYDVFHGSAAMNSFRSLPASHDIFRRYALSVPLKQLEVGDRCLAVYGALILTVRRVQ